MRRLTILQHLDLASWPSVSYNEIDDNEKKCFLDRCQAIELYANGEPIKLIERETRVNRKQLYRMVSRCLTTHADGRPYGYRALLRFIRINNYVRTKTVRTAVKGGAAGAFQQLIERYPSLEAWLKQQIKQRKVLIEQVGTEGRLRTRLRKLNQVHAGFLEQCRRIGITAANYPLNTDTLAIRALATWIKADVLRSFGEAARAAGASHLKGMPAHPAQVKRAAIVRPFQAVEFDGHRLDIRLKLVVQDPLGYTHEFELDRLWLLVILDVCSRAVLGYHLVYGREYNRYDVIKTVEQALQPHPDFPFSLKGLSYGAGGGFPSQKLPETGYATWEWIRLDNAKANLSQESLTALCEFVGCFADAGPAYSPDERPYIERFFGTLENQMSSRLPGYTGSSPNDFRRALSDSSTDLRLLVSLNEFVEIVEASLGAYNGTPHSGLSGRTPIEAMTYFVRGKQQLLKWLVESRRKTLCLMQTARKCTVRGYLETGTRPHINLFGVRYTSRTLAASTTLIGRKLLVYMNADDMRTVRAFLPDGAELGILNAHGEWGVTVHNLKLRREILKERGRSAVRQSEGNRPITDYVQAKLAQAKRKQRRAANELSSALRQIDRTTEHRTPPGPAKPIEVEQTSAHEKSLGAEDCTNKTDFAVPRTLSIGTGHAY